MLKLLTLGIVLFSPVFCLAGGVNLGGIMFLGDSITLGVDGSNDGYRGYLIADFNPPAGYNGVFPAPTGNQGSFDPVGTSIQQSPAGGSAYLNSLDPPYNSGNFYLNNEGHPGASIQDLYDPTNTDTTQYAKVAFDQVASTPGYNPATSGNGSPYGSQNPYVAPRYVYLMIGSNNLMSTPADISQSLSAELSLIGYIKSVDSNLSRIFVEPPPSYPDVSNGTGNQAPAGYDTYATDLGASLLLPPYSSYTTFVDSRANLNSTADWAMENGSQQWLHPDDAGYQIIANDLYNATLATVPEPTQLGFLSLLGCLLLIRTPRTPTAFRSLSRLSR